MTEQCKHEWDFSDGEFPFACLECGAELPLLDVLARLNATERLSAETMRTYLHTEQNVENYDLWTESLQALRDYADTLEAR